RVGRRAAGGVSGRRDPLDPDHAPLAAGARAQHDRRRGEPPAPHGPHGTLRGQELGSMTELPAPFGKYFLCDRIASGGMAEIYLAKLLGPGGFEKLLVIKQIHPELAAQRPFVDLFVAEAKTLVSLSHGNIVPVYELGVVDDTYFIAMEYVDGPTLAALGAALERRGEPMAPEVAAYVAGEL